MTTDRSFVEGADLVLTPIPLRTRRALLPRVTAMLLALQVPFAAAALVVAGGDGADRPITLAEAVAHTEAIDRYRFALSISMDVSGEMSFDDVQMLTGEHADGMDHLSMDFAEIAEAMGQEDEVFGALDPAMEVVLTSDRMYLRAPLFTLIDAQEDEPAPPELQPLVELGDRWGFIDFATVASATATDVASLAGGSAMDLGTALDLLQAADGEVEELGRGEVRGTPVDELRTTVTYANMLEVEGLADAMGIMQASEEELGFDVEDVLEALAGVEIELEVAVDDDGVVRRVAYTFDEDFVEALGDVLGAPPGAMPDDFEVGVAMEVFDLGDPSIEVEEPSSEGAVDLNGWASTMGDLFG